MEDQEKEGWILFSFGLGEFHMPMGHLDLYMSEGHEKVPRRFLEGNKYW
jgi:hypothetical protein